MAITSSTVVPLAIFALLFTKSDANVVHKRALEAPLEIEGGWEYEGCYLDVGRTINKDGFRNEAMTNDMCAEFCYERGYNTFGTEWYHECFCGDKLAPGASEADPNDCNTACWGDEDQPCGGSNRLTLYKRKGPDMNPGWMDFEAIGCWTDSPGNRALANEERPVPANEMTVKKCIEGCASRGYILAGVEFGVECFCGNTITNGHELAEAEDCNYACKGNRTELCGGSGHMNIYDFKLQFSGPPTTTISHTPIPTATEPTPVASDTSSSSTVTSLTSSSSASMTSSASSSASSGSTSPSASVTTSTSASSASSSSSSSSASSTAVSSPPVVETVSSSVSSASRSVSTSASSPASVSSSPSASPSSASASASLSTPSTPSLSATSTQTPSPSASSTTSPFSSLESETSSSKTSTAITEKATVCPGQPKEVLSWNFAGCYTDTPAARSLNANAMTSYQMTLEMCARNCAGYKYFGVEYQWECFCGNELRGSPAKRPASECNMLCGGAQCNFCGAGDRLSVYTIGDPTPPVDPTSTEAPSQSPTAAVPTGLPDGWDYYGCWVDMVNGRILNTQTPDNPKLTLASCVAECDRRGFSIAGTQYYTQCFCGNAIYNGGELADSESQCNTPCGGNKDEFCGGPNRFSIFSRGKPKIYEPPKPMDRVGDWAYAGCVTDTAGLDRTFPWQLIFAGTLTPKICTDACAEFGYAAAGLEYGVECYCGDPENIEVNGARIVGDADCNMPCAGDGGAMCGGPARMTTYFWDGEDPLYSWEFPEDGTPEAGSYEFLIGGVVIPLMTSQAINGKVTFLEKWTTGPPNSTGAYELDLTAIDNFELAWRTMNVKTDLFCAAGVTLPDKAGRQLTVGGWSGESTYGVRLYTPDGSDGVKGTNDWEEDVDILSLQDGRWYPSTLNMANGSILVVGGEEGSNGAPVPTLEILPFTGGAPLYMEWLERTDPNNLYPFLAVLPSKGIFVSYWNEARILDEKTFETIKTLPNIPGAVNDPLGGRTYPLEGTSVLLPQKAPYGDPLGILICGGSTEGIANALDNCVTIYPDSDEPEWVLERMPSKRVMSCMAPLPDGTYLIMNGAKKGVAGFGLASKPNLNAVLYDPEKPIGSRMTVMANTTVARMYHSEALTLLDGRVLVSGSDPQDGVNPQEYRVEVFNPPYLLSGKPRPSFTIQNTDWQFEGSYKFKLGSPAVNGAITASLLGSVSSTHGNSMGARTLIPAVSCSGTDCTVTAPPGPYICTPGWYQFFVLDGGIPAVGVFVRIGGDPAELGNWPEGEGFTRPGM